MESRGYRVVGRVQGVGFRHWARGTAARLGLSGSVRNLPDGSVEVQARGRSDALRAMEDALRGGPPAARVECVERIAASADGQSAEFRIAH
jgi:acylphosphatase